MSNKILVCDDEESIRRALAGFLRKKGCEVTEAKNVDECLSLMKNHQFDTLFFDIKVPALDGVGVLREIERLGIKTHTILTNGVARATHSNKPMPGSAEATPENIHDHQKILVVEDQDMLRGLLKDYLTDQGYEITDVTNGKECVDLTRNNRFDVIFMDVRMPEMDGLQALELLRKSGINTPVILMSGYGDICSTEDAQQRGAQSFLPKPFKLKEALEVLRHEDV